MQWPRGRHDCGMLENGRKESQSEVERDRRRHQNVQLGPDLGKPCRHTQS